MCIGRSVVLSSAIWLQQQPRHALQACQTAHQTVARALSQKVQDFALSQIQTCHPGEGFFLCAGKLVFKIVALDTLLGKRSLIIKIKTRVVTNINIAIFRFNHKSFSSKKKLRGKNCKASFALVAQWAFRI